MDDQALLFFAPQAEGLPLYARLEEMILRAHPDVRRRVQRTQIAFAARYGFAFVWLPRLRGRRDAALGLSLGLGRPLRHPRVLQAVEPYPGRWTCHLLLRSEAELDGELAAWLEEAYAFGCRPGRGKKT